MKDRYISRLGGVVLALVLAAGIGALAQAPTAPVAAIQGLWRSGDSTMRVAIDRSEARAQFVEVGLGARRLGFKVGEISFVATVTGNYLHGEQTIRYSGNCHPNGRKVALMGRLTPDGRTLAIHFYNILVDANCRDTGEYSVSETLWQRAPERR